MKASYDESVHTEYGIVGMSKLAASAGIDMESDDSAHERVTEPPTETQEVNIPLEIQERLFVLDFSEAARAVYDILNERMIPNEDGLYRLALSRLRSGFEKFGSEMYTWDAETRRRNVMEEVADALVYLTSGPIE